MVRYIDAEKAINSVDACRAGFYRWTLFEVEFKTQELNREKRHAGVFYSKNSRSVIGTVHLD